LGKLCLVPHIHTQASFKGFPYNQVATALLVAGSTLTFWIPQFVSTSSYSSVVQGTRLIV